MVRTGIWIFVACLAGIVAAGVTVHSFAATDSLTPFRTEDGYQVVEWYWTADGSGAGQARTEKPLNGLLFRAFWEPCETAANRLAGGQSAAITVKERRSNGAWSALGIDLAGGAIAHNTDTLKTIAVFPASVVPVSGPIQLDLTGATKTGGGGASGKLTLVISNGLAK